MLARPGSPVYNGLDLFVPPLVLMASSLTLLFAFGLVEWIIALILILLYQVYGAPRLVHWRTHQRAEMVVLKNLENFQWVWGVGGIAMALKDLPTCNCVAPSGDWRSFVDDYLSEPDDGQPAD